MENKDIIGMILLHDKISFDINDFKSNIEQKFQYSISNDAGDNQAFVFSIDLEDVNCVFIDFPVPRADILGTAKYAYNWRTAAHDLEHHESHIIVSLTSNKNDQIKRYKIVSAVVSTLLEITNSIGVYKGSQSLLIQASDYVNESLLLKQDKLPINLWIYFGLRHNENLNSGYSYGLVQFGKNEIEIINSSQSLSEIRKFLYNTAYYILENDITFKSGETIGSSEDEIIKISLSRGIFVPGDSFKLNL